MDEQDITAVIGGLLKHAQATENASYLAAAQTGALQAAVDALRRHDISAFWASWTHPLQATVQAMIRAECSDKPEVLFLFEHNRFVEAHLERLFRKMEGSACCVDKARTVMVALLSHFLTGSRIEFDYTGQYTFHLPLRVLTTHEQVTTYFDGLRHLYYGNPERYLAALAGLAAAAQPCVNGPRENI